MQCVFTTLRILSERGGEARTQIAGTQREKNKTAAGMVAAAVSQK
jgi:hypothetical protein